MPGRSWRHVVAKATLFREGCGNSASLLYRAYLSILCVVKTKKKEIWPEICSVLHKEFGSVELVSLALSVVKD